MGKIISGFSAFLLLFSIPLSTFAQEENVSLKAANVNTNLNTSLVPRLDISKHLNFDNVEDYPLIRDGAVAGSLTDSVGSTNTVTYIGTSSSETADEAMNLLLAVQNDSTNKDAFLDIEFYTDNNGALDYIGGISNDMSSSFGNMKLGITLPKSLYKNSAYIYLRLGTSKSQSDLYYSDTTYFKVANPFYTGTALNISSGTSYYSLISNESTNAYQSENTGSLEINNDEYTFNKNMEKEAYMLDYVVPFEPEDADKVTTKSTNSVIASYDEGDSKAFWVTNIETNEDYQLTAKLLYSGTYADVWVNNNEITADAAAQLGKEFDDSIHLSVATNFGKESDVNNDGKVNILAYDIKDGFTGSGGYVAGYFSPVDLYNDTNSNKSEIFYIDTYPLMYDAGDIDVSEAYMTLAHEFQHMVSFNQNVFIQGSTQLDTWLDEGLAMAAEQIYSKDILQSRIDYYNYSTSITSGQSLLNWDYYGDTLANYSLSYLFLQYLKYQAGQGDSIFKEIIADTNSNYKAVENIIHKYIDPKLTFGQFMTNFRAALVLKKDSGPYGFKGVSAFDSLKEKLYSGTTTLSLKGGGAVVKGLSSPEDFSVPSTKGADITYTMLTNSSGTDVPTTPTVYAIGDSDTALSGIADPYTTIFITANGTTIGSGAASSNGTFQITIPKQKAGTKLAVYSIDTAGSRSAEAAVTVQDKTAPSKPKVNTVSDSSTNVTGTAEAGSTVQVRSGYSTIGKTTADSKGAFKITITKQKAGTKLVVNATDKAGNKSGDTSVTVVDKIAPTKPSVSSISDATTYVTGKTEAKAKVYVKRGSTTIGTATADSKGAYKIKIAKQKAGTYLTVYAEDAAHNKSNSVSIKVADKTAPGAPSAKTVTSKSTSISGSAEKGATVYVYRGSKYLGKATVSSNGTYKVKLRKQKKGTSLKLYAKDKAGNKSSYRTIKVK
ncbi:Ig-like domain-containing protein [Bacillus sp. Au-Bac7]|uniref:Ig-like domain-containing protein n=1 Tax=Bacillus sp. Au-Bac7 TaxID=2906458 RepID=UPI001E52D349|nr:Ig-like domain-containing protein [Bacillus sp. Au-Bac7]MCE4049536.1 Ig-like domain-containing protein [Bacillus sp. Au-Bac7]